MTSPSYPLPIVSVDNAFAMQASATEDGDVFTERAEVRLWENNETLIHTIGQYATLLEFSTPEDTRKSYLIALFMHELLYKQGDADRLKQSTSSMGN